MWLLPCTYKDETLSLTRNINVYFEHTILLIILLTTDSNAY